MTRIGEGKPGPGRPKMSPSERLKRRIGMHTAREAEKVASDGQRLAMVFAPAAVARIKEVMDTSKDEGTALAAAEMLLDRAFGRVSAPNNGNNLTFNTLNMGQIPREAALAVIERATHFLAAPAAAEERCDVPTTSIK